MKISDELAKILAQHIREYPTLFLTGGDVLENLFCVIGTGYEWSDGELISTINEPAKTVKKRYSSLNAYITDRKKRYPEPPDDDTVAAWAKDYAREHAIVLTADKRAKDVRVTRRKHYPLSDLSIVNTVPENVKPVWREAFEIVKEMLKWYPDYNEIQKWTVERGFPAIVEQHEV
jgi:hypothetical protein